MYHQGVLYGWNAPGAGSAAVSWNSGSGGASVVSQYDSSVQQQQQKYYQQQLYKQQQQELWQIAGTLSGGNNNSSGKNNDNVTMYTEYYHGWKKIADLPSSSVSHKEWATYYADLSSRAAYFYLQNPGATQPPPDQELPPAPPGYTAPPPPSPPAAVPPPQVVQQQQQQSNHVKNSFQVYVDRCLQKCKSLYEKEAMIRSTKNVLQQAIREGTLHTKDWSQEPLLTISSSVSSQPQENVVGYYGPAPSSPPACDIANKTTKTSCKKKEKALLAKKRSYLQSSSTTSAQDGYYGPSSASSSLSIFNTGSPKRFKTHAGNGFDVLNETLNKRAQRFANSFQQQAVTLFDDEASAQEGPVIVGTCQVLEKDFLRLTSAPKPELVRPRPILEKHFGNLQSEYENVQYRRDYLWFCSQLKAIRQDCTVQHLKNEFSVKVYEFHAKVALEQGDLNEFNQCQTQLKYLYLALEGTIPLPNRREFVSYRILYAAYLNIHSEKATIDMKDILGKEVVSTSDPAVKHAMAVLSASLEGNYHAFFSRLYPSKYGHQNYFLDRIAPVLREAALESMIGAYKPTLLDVEFVCKALQIEDPNWLAEVGCVLETVSLDEGEGLEERVVIKTKESQIKEPESTSTGSKLM